MYTDYRAREYKDACHMAENILRTSENSYLDDLSGVSFLQENDYRPNLEYWNKITGFRALEDDEATQNACERATELWVRSLFADNTEGGFVILKDGSNGGCYYGVNNPLTVDTFALQIPECRVEKTEPSPIYTEYNGFFTGNVSGNKLSKLILNSDIDGIYVACMMIPYNCAGISDRISELENSMAYLDRFKSTQIVRGNSTRRTEDIDDVLINNAIRSLSSSLSYLKDNKDKGFVRTIIKYGAKCESDFGRLHSLIYSALNDGMVKNSLEPVRAFSMISSEYRWSEHLAVPFVCLDDEKRSGLHILSLQTVDNLGRICNPGNISNPYMLVRDYSVDENSLRLFGGENTSAGDIELGVTTDGSRVSIDSHKVCSHVAVFGSAGGGKTTTVMNIAHKAYKLGIPFLVIEAAKKEYIKLLGAILDINVYTPGTNGMMLMLNPLEPEDGTLIENQVDMLVRAIVASHGNEHPIPEGFEGLLKMTYEKYGWNYGMIAYRDYSKPFPTFRDVYENVDEYVNTHANYGPEVKQNLIAALNIRAERLYSGALGNVFAKSHGLRAEDILNSSTIIELDDFSESAKTFITNVLMFKIQSYLAHQNSSRELKRLVIIEEAHNIFRKSKAGEYDRDISNQYFDKMLSEIRSSGTGLVISDQRPSIISEAVIENTAVKIIHALEERNDREIISASLNLSDIQCKKLRELAPGECMLSTRGQYGLLDVYVNDIKLAALDNAYCIMCSGKFNCAKERMQNILNGTSSDAVTELVGKIAMNPYNNSLTGKAIDAFFDRIDFAGGRDKRCCLIGLALMKYSNLPIETQRIILRAYSSGG